VTSTSDRYIVPDWFTRTIFNPTVAFLVRRGIGVAGARVLTVVGRSSGIPRQTIVNLLTVDGTRYLVAPRGNTQWVRNIRVAQSGTLSVGKREERFSAVEVDDVAKPPILRAYLKRWGWEVGKFFEGVDRHADDATLIEIAPGFPVFRVKTDS
jgi:deazaflavin-dependent oxidoreductase (nitroreductase family)